ncbi:MAG: inositol monophosphatase family protein [Terriglobia bacterium]|nr:inositol monophosphatase family protein [Terriglobia bacterium]
METSLRLPVDGKQRTIIDEEAEAELRDAFLGASERGAIQPVHFEGEESLKGYKKKFSGWKKDVCVLADALDGTSLAAMGISLWCSALVIFHKPSTTILGAVVGVPSGRVYVARRDPQTAWILKDERKCTTSEGNFLLNKPSQVKKLSEARIAYYGQKPDSFLSLPAKEKFQRSLRQMEKEATEKASEMKLRIYNVAGTPFLVRLADRKRADPAYIAEGVDAVIEIRKQYPHDFVAGAFIAKRVGAYMCDLSGNEISEAQLGQMLLTPLSKFSYIVASTRELAEQIVESLA